eukprot:CAMPEP_0184487530 /NCGR_PEP_ID=MMETSP0113_2-20130426/10171_1 /TAXON_ID=91329 /ORGANISM="Norrisiella sphaerica, Strain BC52" /LENGTH=244 /DNA_ID=CAMNT_0026869873 /DNA_START=9 /DNA_END=743 /DNA_ORIENTATION=-
MASLVVVACLLCPAAQGVAVARQSPTSIPNNLHHYQPHLQHTKNSLKWLKLLTATATTTPRSISSSSSRRSVRKEHVVYSQTPDIGATATSSLSNAPGDIVASYFYNWNKRDMEAAIDLFAENIRYEDTLYPKVFSSKGELKDHLFSIASVLPESLEFVLDELAVSGKDVSGVTHVGVQWHVGIRDGDDVSALPFTRGCSMYKINGDGKIIYGFDIPEPIAKTGNITVGLLTLLSPILKLLGKK